MPLPKTIPITEEQIEKVMALFDHLTMIRKSDIGGALGNNSMNVYRAMVDELINRGMIRCIQINTSILYERMSFDHDQSDVRKDLMGLLHSHFDGGRSATAASVATELALNINVVKATLEELRKQGKIFGRFVGNLCIYAQQERGTSRTATPEELQKAKRTDPLQAYLQSRKGKPDPEIPLERTPKKASKLPEVKPPEPPKPERALVEPKASKLPEVKPPEPEKTDESPKDNPPKAKKVQVSHKEAFKNDGFVSLKEACRRLKCKHPIIVDLMRQHPPEVHLVRKRGTFTFVHEDVVALWQERLVEIKALRQQNAPRKPTPQPEAMDPEKERLWMEGVQVDLTDLDAAAQAFTDFAYWKAGSDVAKLKGQVPIIAATMVLGVDRTAFHKFMQKQVGTFERTVHAGRTYISVEALKQYLDGSRIKGVQLRSSRWPEGHLTIWEATKALRWSIRTIYQAVQAGDLKAVQYGRGLAFDPVSLQELRAKLDSQAQPPEGWVSLQDLCKQLKAHPTNAKAWLEGKFDSRKCRDASHQMVLFFPPEALEAYREFRSHSGIKVTPALIQALRDAHPQYFGEGAPDLPGVLRERLAEEHGLCGQTVREILKGQIRPEIQPQLPNWPIWSEDRLLKIHHHPLRDEQLALIEGWSVQHIQEIKAATPEYLSAYAAARRLEIERRKRK